MSFLFTVLVLILLGLALAVKIVKQYEQGVLFRLGRVQGLRQPGFQLIVPFVDILHRVSLRIITMPIQSQGIITRDNVSVDVSAVAYFRVVDAVKSVVAIENVRSAIDQIAQTTLRKVVGQHTLDETLSETDRINMGIREILDVTTVEWGVEVTLVELKDIQLPDSMKRAMARQAEAEREKRAKIINAEGESLAAAALGDASDTMMAHPLALQLRNLQTLVEIGVDKNTTVVFPAPLMTTIAEVGVFLAREGAAASPYVVPIGDAVAPNEDAVAPNEDTVAPNEDAVAPNEDAVAPNEDAASPVPASEVADDATLVYPLERTEHA
jgi:SPFH domain / Band 7 family